MSTTREMTRSIHPPKYPAETPRMVPMQAAKTGDSSPKISELREPWIIRDSTSRPNWSVPSQCSHDGSLLICRIDCRSGS